MRPLDQQGRRRVNGPPRHTGQTCAARRRSPELLGAIPSMLASASERRPEDPHHHPSRRGIPSATAPSRPRRGRQAPERRRSDACARWRACSPLTQAPDPCVLGAAAFPNELRKPARVRRGCACPACLAPDRAWHLARGSMPRHSRRPAMPRICQPPLRERVICHKPSLPFAKRRSPMSRPLPLRPVRINCPRPTRPTGCKGASAEP